MHTYFIKTHGLACLEVLTVLHETAYGKGREKTTFKNLRLRTGISSVFNFE
jgi:hypothetical protein